MLCLTKLIFIHEENVSTDNFLPLQMYLKSKKLMHIEMCEMDMAEKRRTITLSLKKRYPSIQFLRFITGHIHFIPLVLPSFLALKENALNMISARG